MSQKSLIRVLSVLCLGLAFTLWWVLRSQPDYEDEYIRSQERVKVLEAENAHLNAVEDSIIAVSDSLATAIAEKPAEREQIRIETNEKRNSIVNLPADSALRYLSKRLSAVHTN